MPLGAFAGLRFLGFVLPPWGFTVLALQGNQTLSPQDVAPGLVLPYVAVKMRRRCHSAPWPFSWLSLQHFQLNLSPFLLW
jgi:hypothetical protein